MKFDLEGRIANVQVPGGPAALFLSIHEAVSNAVHAVEERWGDLAAEKGQVSVSITTDEANLVQSLEIRDNGIGLNPKNLAAFDTCDSRNKVGIGGKGIGRLIWFKLAQHIHVRSCYEGPDETLTCVSFQFRPDIDDTLSGLKSQQASSEPIGTIIRLTDIYPERNQLVRRVSIARELTLHFFAMFISGKLPSISIHYNEYDELNLTEYIKNHIRDRASFTTDLPFRARKELIKLNKIVVERSISTALRNNIILAAHGRMVDRRDIQKRFSLATLPDRQAIIVTAEGDIFDRNVDQERTSFKFTDEEVDYIYDHIIRIIEDHLSEHTEKIRGKQAGYVRQLLTEHPQLALLVKDPETYVKTLSPSMDDEQIGQSLFTLLYRKEKAVTRDIKRLSETQHLSDEAEERAIELTRETTDQARLRLAEYVAKRHQILTIAKTLRRKSGDEGTYAAEKLIHDLICPMGNIFSSGETDAHNLWVIDDLLAYYQFFASDKQIRTFTEGSTSQDEPDAIFFNPLGFERRDTTDPIVIVEFKRPGVESVSSDPVAQVLRYVDQLRSRTVRAFDGEVRSDIRNDTPFECIILCELTETMRQNLRSSLAQTETPDGEGYYGYSRPHNASLRVISYRKMIRDAELRNHIFFDKLGLKIVP